MTLVGIVPAGGSGERLGAERPKAFVVLAGRPMIEWSLDVLGRTCERVVVAVPDGVELAAESVAGGPSRSESVRNAVLAAPEAEVFVVHDAARPLVTDALIDACIDALGENVDGAIAATPVTDTVKQADAGGRVLATLDRATLWAVQTPQVFRADSLRRALDVDPSTLAAATDDASLVEATGGSIALVASENENFKVTTALDLRRAESVLQSRC
ncbi:MAG: 2-C-methyl-D-erythritol 4-phosphate cytidylyltransferase [Thermoleophilaceae bacterium]